MDVTLEASEEEIWTSKWTAMLPPAGIDLPVQRTVVSACPPWSAEMNVVFAGIGSVIVTPVAAALPMLRTVSV